MFYYFGSNFYFLALLIAFILIFSLRKRVGYLESVLKIKKGQIKEPTKDLVGREDRAVDYQRHNYKPGIIARFFLWLKEDWLLKIGAVLIFIGFAWLVVLAFLNNWIGPMGRVALGIFSGVAILILGWWRIQKEAHQGSIFMSLGALVLIFTVAAARFVYNFFTPIPAFGLMFLAVAFMALASVRFRVRSLAVIGLLIGSAIPFAINFFDFNYVSVFTDVEVFTYLLVLIIGALWIVFITGWRFLTPLALIIISFYSFLYGFVISSSDSLRFFAYAFASLFFLTNTVGIIKTRDKNIVADLLTAGGNGLFLLWWIIKSAPENLQSLIIVAWMIVFLVGSYSVYYFTKKTAPFLVYAGVGLMMLAVATAIELEGAALVIALAVEAAAAVLTVYFVSRSEKLTNTISLLLIGPIALSLPSVYSGAWSNSIIHEDFFILLVMTLVLIGVGEFLRRLKAFLFSSSGLIWRPCQLFSV